MTTFPTEHVTCRDGATSKPSIATLKKALDRLGDGVSQISDGLFSPHNNKKNINEEQKKNKMATENVNSY